MPQSSAVTITSISSAPSSGQLGAGRTITFALTPSQSVQVAAGAGGAVPYLTLNDGATAGYTGQDGSGNLLFGYTVAAGQNTSDLVVTGLQLNGATVTHAATLSLASPATFGAGSFPDAVAVADLNGDGKPDLVASGGATNSGTVSVLLGNGSGGFGNAATYTAGNDPFSVTTADVNGDGKPDVIAANYQDGTVSVLLGDGSGGLASQTTYAAGAYPYFVTAADVNGDGKPDLVVANRVNDAVSVLLNGGSGGFGSATAYSAGSNPQSVAVADVNGDGKPDLVVADYSGNAVSVLLGNGAGSFSRAVSYAAGSNPQSVAVADLNGDGKPDIAVTNYTGNGSGAASVLLNGGSGGFGSPVAYTVGNVPTAIAAADVNGDGTPDLLTANENSNTVSVLLGNGSGGFNPAVSFPAGSRPVGLAVADLNGDGKPDAVTTNGLGNAVAVLLDTSTVAGSLDPSSVGSASGRDTGLVIDTTAPTVTEALANDTGLSGTDRLTYDPTVTGTGDANATVTILNGSAVLGTTTADGTGRYSFRPTLSDGSYTLTASETDAAGNTGTAATSFTLDATPPSASLAATDSTSTGTTASEVHYLLTLSEAVSGLGTGSFSVSQGGNLSGAAVTGLSQQDATHYLVTVSTGTTGNGALSVTLPRAGSGVADAAGNALGADAAGPAYTVVHSPNFTVLDTTTGQQQVAAGDAYTGPVAGLQYQYLNFSSDNLNVVANRPNTFIHTGAGTDAIDVSAVGGTNVLDGGTGSNFLVGGTGPGSQDTFFVDDRSPPADIWSTVANFHAGDAATVFGITAQDYALQWVDGQGAAGYTGLTLHATASGQPTASLTLAGYTTADLSNGRLTTSFGTVNGSNYLYIQGTG